MQNQLIKSESEVTTIEPKLMDVLVYLSSHAPDVVSSDQIIDNCWPNQYLSDNPVHKSIAQLRKILGDKAKNSHFIKTIPKKGYSIIAPIKGLNQNKKINKPWIDGSPYPGLHHYNPRYQHVFFGRNKSTSEIKFLINQIRPDKKMCLLLLGASGVGKTSLMKTVILPYLKNPADPFKINFNEVYEYTIPIQKEHSFIQSFIKFLQEKYILEPVLDQARQVEIIRNNPNEIFKILKISNLKNQANIIFIDQLERIFVGQNQSHNEITLFFDIINELLKSKFFLIIIALKNEYYTDVMKFDGFENIKKQSIQYDLLSPTLAEITEIVNLPVAAAGLTYEYDTNSYESLNNIIISDAQNIGNVLPILSHTLNELCSEVNGNNEISIKSYKELGGLIGSLANKADEIYQIFSKMEIQSFKNKLHHLIQFAPEKNNKIFCAKAELQQFNNTPSQVIIAYLIEAHLLQSEIIENKSFVSIIHESLLDESLFFKSWINDNQLNLSIINEIKTLSNQWNKNNHNSDYMLKNKFLLQKCINLTQTEKVIFEPREQNFIQVSSKKIRHKHYLKSIAVMLLIILLFISSGLLYEHQKLNSQLSLSQQEAEKLIGYMLDELNNKLRPIGKLDLLDGIGAQVLNYYAAISYPTASKISVLQRIEALNTLGEVEVKKGHLIKAQQYFSTALKPFEISDNKFSNNTALMFKLSQTYYWLGYIGYINNNAEIAEKYWQNYLNLTQKMTILEPQNNQWQLELSYALNNLGTLYYKNNKYKKAKSKFDLSAKIKQSLMKTDPQNGLYIAELADTLSWQASIYDKNNQLVESLSVAEKSLVLAQQLITLEPNNSIWKQRLGQALYRLALKDYDLGKLKHASELINKSLPILIQLQHNDMSNQQWLKELTNNYLLLAKIYRHQGNLDDAMVNINKAESQFNLYSQETLQMKETIIQKFDFLVASSLLLLSMKKPKAAASQFTEVSNILNQLNTVDENKIMFFNAYSTFILAQIQSANNLYELSNSTISQAREYSDKTLKTNKDNKKYMALSIAINNKIKGINTDNKIIEFLNKINYKNPDFINQEENI